MATLIHAYRPQVWNYSTDEIDFADRLVVVIEEDDTHYTAELPFDDYAGLEAEWNAGSATTVLVAACNSWLSAHGDGYDPAPSVVQNKYGEDLTA